MARLRDLASSPVRWQRRAARVVIDPRLLWLLVAIFVVRIAVLDITVSGHRDGVNLITSTRQWFSDPVHAYDRAEYSLSVHRQLSFDGLPGLATDALLASPAAVLPPPFDLLVWTLADALCLFLALALLERRLAPTGWRRPLFWLIAAVDPPVFAELDAGQRGGFILLLSVAAILSLRRRPLLAGVFAGAATAVKVYPAAMLLGIRPRRLLGFGGALGATAIAIAGAAFLRGGIGAPYQYLTRVFIPALSVSHPDCAETPITNMLTRSIGGESFPTIDAHGATVLLTSPIHLPALARVLGTLLVLAVIATAGYAAWRSGWHTLYAPAVTLALGGLVPGELYPYQYLPLLPVTLIVAMKAVAEKRYRVLAGIAIGLLTQIRGPCDVFFPNLWTIGGLILFGVAVSQARRFRDDDDATDADASGSTKPAAA